MKKYTTPNVQYAYADGSVNRARLTGIVYPDGRLLRYEYNSGHDDHLSRVSFLADDNGGSVGTHLAEYAYLGLNVFVKVDYTEPQIRYDLAAGAGDDPYDGLDRFDRVVDLPWRNYGAGADAEHLKYGYDRASNRRWRQNLVSAALSPPVRMDELYGYDGLYQLQDFQRGELNAAKDALVAGTLEFAQQWSFDATGNWHNFKEDDNGSGSWSLDQTRTHSEVNEITAISGGAWIDPAYDRNGNTTTFPQPAAPTAGYSAVYDAWNRLMSLAAGATPVADYRYDGLYRRVTKSTGGVDRHFYFSNQWQALEERLGSNTSADRQYVWGIRYIDDCVLRDDPAPQRLYAMQDANWNCIAIADEAGQTKERYGYEAYGLPLVMDSVFAVRTSSLFDWSVRFAGYQIDTVSGLYEVRYRTLHVLLGRWNSRDPIQADINLYRYCTHNPLTRTDPTGLDDNVAIGDLSDWVEKMATSEKCKAEAKRIAAAIQNTFDKNNPWYFPRFYDQRNKGYYCYEWAYGFEDAANHESSGNCFTIRVEEAANEKGRVHFWIVITSKENPKNKVYVDDGFYNGSYVHDKRPIPDGWTLGSPGDVPRNNCCPSPGYDSNGNPIAPPKKPSRGGKPFIMPPTIFGPYPETGPGGVPMA